MIIASGLVYGPCRDATTGTPGPPWWSSTAGCPESDAVRSELQADCLAGVWAYQVRRIPARNGVPLITDITDEDVAEAIDAAQAVGDDRIQDKTQGQANPETYTHGTADQRRRWFDIGLRSGDLGDCDTWRARSL